MAVIIGNGGVGERLKPAVLKTVRPERVSGVRIPPPPPSQSHLRQFKNTGSRILSSRVQDCVFSRDINLRVIGK
jgi:hypothetical protein